MSEVAVCYEPERLMPKKKKPLKFGSVQSTFYVSRQTRFNFDQMGLKPRTGRPIAVRRRRMIL